MNTLDLSAAARHALAVVGVGASRAGRVDGVDHPVWCARAHHCTAGHTSGSHRSIPEVWDTDVGRVVAVRTRRARDGVDHLELSLVVELAYDDTTAQRQSRALIAATAATVHDILTDQAAMAGGAW